MQRKTTTPTRQQFPRLSNRIHTLQSPKRKIPTITPNPKEQKLLSIRPTAFLTFLINNATAKSIPTVDLTAKRIGIRNLEETIKRRTAKENTNI